MLFSSEGLYRTAYLHGLPLYSKLTNAEQVQVYSYIKFFHDLCLDQMGEALTLQDSRNFLWRAFIKLGLSPEPHFFENFRDDHIVEMHSRSGAVLFRNLKFFEYCSYSFEELYTQAPTTLFEFSRDTEVFLAPLKEKIFQGTQEFREVRLSYDWKEKSSMDSLEVQCEVEFMHPLYSKGDKREPAAVILLKRQSLFGDRGM
ncbi:MAG: hypothetical protein AAGB31_08980 [Bdellovibrio sp.]